MTIPQTNQALNLPHDNAFKIRNLINDDGIRE